MENNKFIYNNIYAFYSSDKRLKENIRPIENALGKLKSCPTWRFKEDRENFVVTINQAHKLDLYYLAFY